MGEQVAASGRPFWVHQLVEYILGGALVAVGAQSPTPVVPAVVGGILLLWAASTRGALSAFRLVDRRLHRVVDPLIALTMLVAAVQPAVEVEVGARAVLGAVAVVHLVVWRGSQYHEGRRPRSATVQADGDATATAADDRATEVGRLAGRAAASGVNAVRRAAAKHR